MNKKVSRKRNKGKDRKAKKAEKDREKISTLWRGWVKKGDPHRGITQLCDHGCYLENLENDHPVANFMNAYFEVWCIGEMGSLKILPCLFHSQRDIFISDHYRNMVIVIFTRIGTNMLLRNFDICNVLNVAKAITVLEHYDGTSDIVESTIHSRVVASKLRDLDPDVSSNKRDVLKLFSKRTSCSCLKVRHSKARKSIPKMGMCHGCEEEKERVSLSICTRCMVGQFCSRECQVANWDNHKGDCDILVCAHNNNPPE